jgi:DNA primase
VRRQQHGQWLAFVRFDQDGTKAFRQGNALDLVEQYGLAHAAQASQQLAKLPQTISPREALILKTLLNHPWLIDEHSEAVAELDFKSAALAGLRDQILAIHAGANSLDSTTLAAQLTKSGVAKVVDLVARTITHNSDRFAEPDASAADVETAWTHILALHQRQDALGRMLKAAEDAWRDDCSEEAWARLLDVKQQIAIHSAADCLEEQGESEVNFNLPAKLAI